MKKSIGVLVIAATLGIGFTAPAVAETVAQTTEAPGAQRPWLGVTLSSVPRALSRQLGKLIPDGQGVMIEGVSPNSPAARAGLEPWDVLLTMNGQKLYSPQQLAALVAKSKPGSEVTFQLVREGRLETVKARLGGSPELSRVRPGWRHHPTEPPRFRPWRIMPPHADIPGLPRQESINVMEQFEAISIQKLGNDRYRAEIEFLDDNGEKRKFSAEGNYDEVRKQIADNPDLPEQRKNSLLNALKMNPDVLLPDEFGSFLLPPPMPPMPRFDEFFDLPDSWF